MISKIEYIRDMAVFKDFNWRVSLRDSGNNHIDFKKLNIFYGRNYSGKTTLSRIFRSLETGYLSNRYGSPKFEISFSDGKKISNQAITSHGEIVRVFNEDFIKENLKFITDDRESINPFAILGDKNTELEEKIEKSQSEIGSIEEKLGLEGELGVIKQSFNRAIRNYEGAKTDLDNLLRDKANNSKTGIKHNVVFGNANYQITNIKKDIEKVQSINYRPLDDNELSRCHELLKNNKKDEIPILKLKKIKLDYLADQARHLVEKEIQVSEPILELLSDSLLSAWVKDGIQYHRGKHTHCGFCGNSLPESLWDKLDKHFNQESKNLEEDIDKLLELIKHEKSITKTLFVINL